MNPTDGQCAKCGESAPASAKICPFCKSLLPWAPGYVPPAPNPVGDTSTVKFLPSDDSASQGQAGPRFPRVSWWHGVAFVSLLIFLMVAFLFEPVVKPRTYAFNIHFMMGKGVDSDQNGMEMEEVETFLLTPPDDEIEEKLHEEFGIEHAAKMWTRHGVTLQVFYRIANRQVLRLVLTPEGEEAPADAEELLAWGNLKEDDPDYSIELMAEEGEAAVPVEARVIPTKAKSAQTLLESPTYGLYVGQTLYEPGNRPLGTVLALKDIHPFPDGARKPAALVIYDDPNAAEPVAWVPQDRIAQKSE